MYIIRNCLCLVSALCLSTFASAQTKTVSEIVETYKGGPVISTDFRTTVQQVIANAAAFNPRVLSQDTYSRALKMESGDTIFEFGYDANGKIDFTKANGKMLRQRISTDTEGNLVLRNFLEDGTELDPSVLAKKDSARYASRSQEYRAMYPEAEPIDLVAFEASKKIKLEKGYQRALEAHRARAVSEEGVLGDADARLKRKSTIEQLVKVPDQQCLYECDRGHANDTNACQTVSDIGEAVCEAAGTVAGAACKVPIILARGGCIENSNNRRYQCQVRC